MEKEIKVKEKGASSKEKLDKGKDEIKGTKNKELKELAEKIQKASSATERWKFYARIADEYPGDAVASVAPVLGDIGSSFTSSVFFLKYAKEAGLGTGAGAKAIGLQAADSVVGAVPILGDVLDYFFKANKWSISSFTKHLDRLKKEAIKKGMSEEDVEKLMEAGSKTTKEMEKIKGVFDKPKTAKKDVDVKK